MSDTVKLLSPPNINKEALNAFAKEATEEATNHKLPSLEYVKNHYNQEDAAIFDFTALYQAEHSSLVVDKGGKTLLMAIVGDSLLEVHYNTLHIFHHLLKYLNYNASECKTQKE